MTAANQRKTCTTRVIANQALRVNFRRGNSIGFVLPAGPARSSIKSRVAATLVGRILISSDHYLNFPDVVFIENVVEVWESNNSVIDKEE